MNEFYKTKGIVIGKRDFLDSDKILTVVTENMGKISVKAKGVKKIKAKMAGHLEMLNYVDLELVKGKSFFIVTGAQVIDDFNEIKNDFDKISVFYYFAEVLSKILAEDEPQDRLFRFFLSVLRRLNEKEVGALLLVLFFELNVLEYLGFSPEMLVCVGCRERVYGHSFVFSGDKGGVLCETCEATDLYSTVISQDAIKLMRILTMKDLSFVEKVRIPSDVLKEVKRINNFFIGHILDREIKSMQFITV